MIFFKNPILRFWVIWFLVSAALVAAALVRKYG